MARKTLSEIYWEDPLSFQKLKPGQQVTLTGQNGIVADFMIGDIQSEGLILLPLGSRATKQFAESSITVSASMDFGGRKLKKGDEILLRYKDFPPKKYFVDYSLNNSSILLKDKKGNDSLMHMILNLIGRQ